MPDTIQAVLSTVFAICLITLTLLGTVALGTVLAHFIRDAWRNDG
jgi:hypothetical protein